MVCRCRFALAALCLAASLLGALAQDAEPENDSAAYAVYIAQPGDSLIGVARQFNTSLDALVAANDLGETRELYVGQSLLVPAIKSAFFQHYTVQPGDTLFLLALRFETNVGVLKGLNGITDESLIQPGATLIVPAVRHEDLDVHIVAAGDSLYSISRRYNTDVALLKSLNGISGDGRVRVGESLFVPRLDESQFDIYEIASGDTLYNISRRFQASVAQLRELNGISSSLDLTVGRSILVPKIDETLFDTVLVEPGDSLYAISRRHDVSLAALQQLNRLGEAGAIQAGQQLLVPKLENAVLDVHVIGLGDSLAHLAETYETTVELLQTLNDIPDPRVIQLEDSLLVPKRSGQLARAGFGTGIQVFIDGENAGALAAQVRRLGVNWVKLDVPWARIEPQPGRFDYAALDATLAEMDAVGVKLLLNVFDAPAWSRADHSDKLPAVMRDYGGPPAALDDFARFLANLVTRYAGIVDAYEIWKSPNLLKYWMTPIYEREPQLDAEGDYGMPDGVELGAGYYLPLLQAGYETIKAYDRSALVISGGLAPVGLSDGYNSIDTGTFLRDMLALGAGDYSDAIGAAFGASAVPPTLSCCDKPPGVDSHYESFLQYFPELMAFYDEVLLAHDMGDMPIVATQVGWGTGEGVNIALPSSGFEWLHYTSEAEQALYVTQAYQIVGGMEGISAMFLYNLNGCAVADEEACFFSLVDAAGEKRPVFAAFEALPKSASG